MSGAMPIFFLKGNDKDAFRLFARRCSVRSQYETCSIKLTFPLYDDMALYIESVRENVCRSERGQAKSQRKRTHQPSCIYVCSMYVYIYTNHAHSVAFAKSSH